MIVRTIRIGGVTRADLLRKLETEGIQLNPAARQLLSSELFQPLEADGVIQTVEVTVGQLGFPEGATMPEIQDQARQMGLIPCPLEVGSHLRLQYRDQPEGAIGFPVTKGQAPPRSLTVVSVPLSNSDELPKGLYLRRIEGVLWLRGYRSDDLHVWHPDDRLLFRLAAGASIAD